MNLEDLKAALADSTDDLYRDSVREGEDLEEVRSNVRKSRRRLKWRDYREILACVFVFMVFIPVVFTNLPLMTRLGATVSCVAAVLIGIRIFFGRLRHRVLPELSVNEFLEAEIAHLDYQIQLLQTATWWFFAPVAVGYLMFVWGLMPIQQAVIASAAYFVMDRVICGLNLHVIRADLIPEKKELVRVYQSLNDVVEVNAPSKSMEE